MSEHAQGPGVKAGRANESVRLKQSSKLRVGGARTMSASGMYSEVEAETEAAWQAACAG